MKCQHCGSEVRIGERFCSNCYVPLEYNYENQKLLEEQELATKRKNKQTKVKKGIINFSFALVGLCVIVFIGFNIFFDGNTGDFNFNKVNSVVSKINENKTIEEENKRPKVTIGNGITSKSYEISLLDVDIVDETYEKAILYNFKDGEEYAFVKLQIRNLTYEDTSYTSLLHFDGYCDGNQITSGKSGTLGEVKKYMTIDGLNPRRQTKVGYISYSVPKDWKKIEINVKIEGKENEPVLIIENPKNRVISEIELESIIEKCEVREFLDNEKIFTNDVDLYNIITEFMHINCLSKTDIIPTQNLLTHIKNQFQ